MQRIAVYKYFWLGTCVRYLQDANPGTRIDGDSAVLFNIGRLLAYLDDIGLPVTSRTAAVTRLNKLHQELSKLPSDEHQVLSEIQSTELVGIIKELRPTLEAETRVASLFLVAPKRIDVNKLLDDVQSLFPPGIYSALPEIAQYDFREGGRCIAFSVPTAAAFHMLRATEAVLRHFYTSLIRQRRVSPLLWGPMVEDLRKRPKTMEHQTLYNHLDNIRTSYRNPTQHPEATYDIHEAQDLWGLATEATNRMMRILIAT